MSLKEKFRKFFEWEYGSKTKVFAVISLCLTVAFAIMNCVIAVRDRSFWHGAITVYYFLLIAFRGVTIAAALISKRRYQDNETANREAQNKIYLGCGAFLVIVEIAMGVAVTQMVLYGRPVRNSQIFAIATAVYAFYKITMAIINLVKANKHADPVSQALRNLNFADACMSMVSLTVLMLTTFDTEQDGTFSMAMKACIGFAACAAVLALATVMIVKSAKKLRKKTDDERKEL